MPRFVGQILRYVGLLIEMLGILSLAFRTGTDEAGTPLPGSFPIRLVWIAIGSGFVIWILGTIVNFWSQAGRTDPLAKRSNLDLDL